MKSYSLELVQRKTGTGAPGKIALLAALGAGAYLGYKRLTDVKKNPDFSDGRSGSTYDSEAHEGEDFTARILRAAKRIIR